MKQHHVVVYSIPTCPDCHDAKRYFQEKGVSFQEKDCTTNPDYPQEVYDLTGKQVVPTIVVDGHVFVGFSNNYEEIHSLFQK
jgi:glutaredoxin 3